MEEETEVSLGENLSQGQTEGSGRDGGSLVVKDEKKNWKSIGRWQKGWEEIEGV